MEQKTLCQKSLSYFGVPLKFLVANKKVQLIKVNCPWNKTEKFLKRITMLNIIEKQWRNYSPSLFFKK